MDVHGSGWSGFKKNSIKNIKFDADPDPNDPMTRNDLNPRRPDDPRQLEPEMTQ